MVLGYQLPSLASSAACRQSDETVVLPIGVLAVE